MTATGTITRQPERISHWLGEPVAVQHGTYDQIADSIPTFGRRPFALYSAPPTPDELPLLVGENPYYDEVMRLSPSGQPEVPVGIVSKSYKLIQHREIFETSVRALHEAKVPLNKVMVYLTLTKFGGRMAVRFVMPKEFGFDPGDSHPLHLRLECFNSVDGSTRFVILLSWYRLVCSNGLILRIAGVHEAIIHTETAKFPDIRNLVVDGIASLEDEGKFYSRWLHTRVSEGALVRWVDGALNAKWGALAAARVQLICQTGFDGVFSDSFEKAPPSRKKMVTTETVPGAFQNANHAYAVSQALAWVARQRLDVQDQLDYMKQIPDLMNALVPA